ncbi:MAG TPA: acyltransferase [Candidatus Eremiobacteraceae bacterium]
MIGRFLRSCAAQLRAAYRDQELRDKFPHLRLSEGVVVRGLSHFTAGRNTLLDRRAYLNCSGGAWNAYKGFIKIGENCEIGPYAVLWGAGGITIGDNVHIGAHVSITAHEARQIDPDSLDIWKPLSFDFAPVVIEDHTLVCSGSVIVPGVTIGHHSMIGAGAVVVSDIPPYSLAVGCPARVLRSLRPRELTNQSA